MTKKILIGVALPLLLLMVLVPAVSAANTCTFNEKGATWRLDSDCTTDETILIPDGITLDGVNHEITAVDPSGGHFVGAVVQNEGSTAYVTRLHINTADLANVCDSGDDRLRGIMFEGASGSITHSTIVGINQGASGCQEGNGIEIRNEPFDGTHPGTITVEISHNTVEDYQKTGIVANGDVEVSIHHNAIGKSATQENLAANSIQLGYGALGSVTQNIIDGNQWMGTSDWVATAILIYEADVVDVSNNNIGGNSDIGLYIYADNGTYDNNRIFDEGADHPNSGYDYGLGNWGADNTVTNNKVRGFDVPYDGVEDGTNKTIPGGPFPGE
ncbi:MAG: right-handed parallel beta-helix repeat-containing protein [Anaerolineae bacterium]|nr:right-handed parallel beta-helix repeat-containing protein [Anaerolineae bacterium]